MSLEELTLEKLDEMIDNLDKIIREGENNGEEK